MDTPGDATDIQTTATSVNVWRVTAGRASFVRFLLLHRLNLLDEAFVQNVLCSVTWKV